MTPQRLGILHPGQMGISLAASAQNSGHEVHWASEGRSGVTHARAAQWGLQDSQTVAQLCAECAILVSVCPPDAAESVARQVMATGFTGLYVEANAISPQSAIHLGVAMEGMGIRFVDGGIIGGPAWEPGTTRLYLAGAGAEEVAACFAAGPLATQVLGTTIGEASALKMCYAAYTKGTTALLAAILATAAHWGVGEALSHQWTAEGAAFADEVPRRVRRVTAKAWRFVGEMEEISATFRAAGMPGDFHAAAAAIYRRLTPFKDAPAMPPLEDVLAALLQAEDAPHP